MSVNRWHFWVRRYVDFRRQASAVCPGVVQA
jgi:hypothetical protein